MSDAESWHVFLHPDRVKAKFLHLVLIFLERQRKSDFGVEESILFGYGDGCEGEVKLVDRRD